MTDPTRPAAEALELGIMEAQLAVERMPASEDATLVALVLDQLRHVVPKLIVRADATREADERIAGLERDLATFTAEPDILHRIGMEQTTYWCRQTLLADGKARAAESEVAALRAALEFLWRRLNRMNDGPGMYLIEHVLFCGCGDDQHLWDRSGARGALAALAARPVADATLPTTFHVGGKCLPFDPTNHHNAARCPYCTARPAADVDRCAYRYLYGDVATECGRPESQHGVSPAHPFTREPR